jgi:hypothetical protein
VNYVDKRRYPESFDVQSTFPGSSSVLKIDESFYVGFQSYAAIQSIFLRSCQQFMRRMIDPYALHVGISRYQRVRDIESYFSKYGDVLCTVEHESTKGRYVFVNFMTRGASLRALQDGAVHVVKGSRVKIRSKVLSASEPFAPAPYSPARFTM